MNDENYNDDLSQYIKEKTAPVSPTERPQSRKVVAMCRIALDFYERYSEFLQQMFINNFINNVKDLDDEGRSIKTSSAGFIRSIVFSIENQERIINVNEAQDKSFSFSINNIENDSSLLRRTMLFCKTYMPWIDPKSSQAYYVLMDEFRTKIFDEIMGDSIGKTLSTLTSFAKISGPNRKKRIREISLKKDVIHVTLDCGAEDSLFIINSGLKNVEDWICHMCNAFKGPDEMRKILLNHANSLIHDYDEQRAKQ